MDSQWGPETFGTKITNIVFFRIIRKKWVVPSTDVEPGPTRIPDHGSGKMRDASREDTASLVRVVVTVTMVYRNMLYYS